jgi:hypothetical protein
MKLCSCSNLVLQLTFHIRDQTCKLLEGANDSILGKFSKGFSCDIDAAMAAKAYAQTSGGEMHFESMMSLLSGEGMTSRTSKIKRKIDAQSPKLDGGPPFPMR